MLIDSAAMTIAGKTKGDNEENCYLNGKYKYDIEEKYKSIFDRSMRKRSAFAVFRGSGGGEYGGVAALIGASILKKFQNKDINNAVDRYVQKANNEICKYILDSDGIQSAAAVSLLYICNNKASVFNIGDGCVFHLHKGKLKKFTAESPAEHLGKFANEAPVICEKMLNIQISETDKFLLCCRELSDNLSDSEILTIMKQKPSAREITDGLLKKAMQNGAEGTLTAITVDCLREEKSKKKAVKFPITGIAAAVVLLLAIAVVCALNGDKIFFKDSTSVKIEKAITEKKKEPERKQLLPEDNDAANEEIGGQPVIPEQNSEPNEKPQAPKPAEQKQQPAKRGNAVSNGAVTEKKMPEKKRESENPESAQKSDRPENSPAETDETEQKNIPMQNSENPGEAAEENKAPSGQPAENESEQMPENNQSKTDMGR